MVKVMLNRRTITIVFLLLDGEDFIPGPYEIIFTEGYAPPLMECVVIHTINDDMLEGDHFFRVGIEDIAPEGAVYVNGKNKFIITITDDADGKQRVGSYAKLLIVHQYS